MTQEALYLDTNILIDIFNETREFHKSSLRLRVAELCGDVKLWASASSFTDVFYILRRDKSLSSTIQDIFLETPTYLNICSLDQQDILNASAKKWADFEDCLINECAEKVHAHYIITRDKEGFIQSNIPAITPEEYFEHLEHDKGIFYEDVDF